MGEAKLTTFFILGPPQFTQHEQPKRLHSAKATALLAYLVCHPGRVHNREALAALLWGNFPDNKARQSLRQALYSLRRALGELAEICLKINSQTVTFHPAPDLYVDYLIFNDLLNIGNARLAVRLYQGELLEGIALDDSPAFEEWLFLARDRTNQRMISATQMVVDDFLERGNAGKAIEFGQQLVALDPLNEGAYQRLMRAQAAQGDRDALRRTYIQCRDFLERELGVEPTDRTIMLYEQLYKSQPPIQNIDTALQTVPVPAFPFQGCKEELRALADHYRQALEGGDSLVFIEGEAGSGTTELVLEFYRRVIQEQPVELLMGTAYEAQLETPYAIWADAFAALGAPEAQNRLRGLDLVWRQQLARLVPEISTHPSDDEGLSSSENHLRFMQGVVQSLIHLVASGPMILFFDDLHWSDAASLELLHYIARQCRSHPIFVVGTYRSEAIQSETTLQRFFNKRRYKTLVISPLQKRDIQALLDWLGYSDYEIAVERLATHSQGNRFMFFETLRFLQESEKLDLLFSKESLPIPPRIQELIAARMARLNEQQRRVLAAAAVIGRPFDLSLLHHVSGQPEMALLEDVAALVDHAFLEENESRGVEQIAFRHTFVSQVTYDGLSRSHQRALHRRTGDALLQMHQSQSFRVTEEVAFHFEQAGDNRAVFFLELASEQAERMYALPEATHFLSRALSFQARYASKDQMQRFKLLLVREHLLARQGHRANQAKDIAELISLAEAINDPICLAQVWLRQAGYLSDTGESQLSKQAAERSLSLYREINDQQGEALAMRELGFLYWSTRDYNLALSFSRRALQLHRKIGDIHGEASALHNLAEIHRGLDSPSKAISFYEQSLQLSWARQDHQRQCLSLYGMAHTYRQLGRKQRALETYQETLEQAELAGDKIVLSRVYHETATLLTELGDLEGAASTMRKAAEISRRSGYTTGLTHSLLGLGYIHTQQGQTKEAYNVLNKAIEWFGILEDQEALQFVAERIRQLDQENEFEQPPAHMGWVKTYVTLTEGKVYCEFESPLAGGN